MDRDISIGNRVVANYMQEKQKKRLKQRLQHIKKNKSQYSSQGIIKEKPRTNSVFFEKNYEIQKQNAALFNRIASIIKKTPKVNTQSSTSLQKSRQTTAFWHRKIQSSLEQQNKIIQKRLFNQKPTINNKSFYQQRAKHLQYLKNMGKYPYILNKKIKTEPDCSILDEMNINMTQLPPLTNNNASKNLISPSNAETGVKQLFRHCSLDFTITVSLDLKLDLCTFFIQNNLTESENYSLTIPKLQFVTYFEQSQYDYEKMVSNLRLNDDGKIIYSQQMDSNKNPTPIDEKESLKFRPQSTAYTSSGFKYGFRSSKRNIIEKNEKKQKEISKTDRKPYLPTKNEKNVHKIQPDTLSQNNFNEIKLFQKD